MSDPRIDLIRRRFGVSLEDDVGASNEPGVAYADDGLEDHWPSGHVAGPFDDDEIAELERR